MQMVKPLRPRVSTWSLIQNGDDTKTITRDNRVVGIYAEVRGRWIGVRPNGSMFWSDSDADIYDQLVEEEKAHDSR